MNSPWSPGFSSGFGVGNLWPKTVIAKVYTPAGVLITTWDDLIEPPSFSWNINGGLSETTITLPRTFGSMGEPGELDSLEDIAFSNVVKLHIFDQDSPPEGVLIYQGIIDQYEINLGTNKVAVKLVPKTSLQQDRFVRGPLDFTDYNPTDILRYFATPAKGYLPGVTFRESDSADADQVSTVTFEKEKITTVLETIQKLAGGHWYWRFNPDNTISFNKWDNQIAADHVLVIGKHVGKDIQFIKTKFDVKYRVYVYGADEERDDEGVLEQEAIEAVVSEPGYDETIEPRDMVYVNPRITDYATAMRIGRALLEFHRDVSFETEVLVFDSGPDPFDNGYDIESFKPGQTVSLLNPLLAFAPRIWGDDHIWGDEGIWGGTMLESTQLPLVIEEVEYHYYDVKLKLKSHPRSLPEEIVNLSERVLLIGS